MLPSTRICFFLAFSPFLLPSWLFYSIVRTGWCLSFMAWKTCGLLGSCSLPFIPSWTRRCLGKGLHLSVEPMFSSLVSIGLLVIDPAISLCRAYYSFTFLHTTLWTCGLIFLLCQPTSSSIFCSRLPWPTFHIFTSFRLCWPTFLLCQPNSLLHFPSFPVPFTSSLPLIISMGLLLHSLGFLGPFTPSLPIFILMSFPAINPTISTYWACFLVPLLFFLSHLLYIVGLLLLLGHLSKVGINSLIFWCVRVWVCLIFGWFSGVSVLRWWWLTVLGCGAKPMCGW